MKDCVIGLDYGTDSVRAVLVSTVTGQELGSSVYWYPRWKLQKYCNASINQFRQHPADHIEGLEYTIKEVLAQTQVDPHMVKGICIDTTGSSPLPLNREGVALAMTPDFAEDADAMMVLWKDHTSIAEADLINQLAKNWGGIDYTKYVGGIYSSEWFWAKILHIIKSNEKVKEAAYTWMEHCDYMTYLLVEDKSLNAFKRSRCAAGHKAMWSEEWQGLPSESFLSELHPYLATLRARLYRNTYTSDLPAGYLSKEWADRLGLTTNTTIAVGTFDAHAGAVGAGIGPRNLVRVMGTSTCDIMVSEPSIINDATIKGICGQVDGSVLPGWIGLEAGQSGFGDVLAWYKEMLMWPIENFVLKSNVITDEQKQSLYTAIDSHMIEAITAQSQSLPIDEHLPTALDWINGRRTPDADQSLKSALSGLSLGTKAPHVFKSLIYAICFGSKKIVERFESEGVVIDKITGIGGVARKSPYIMQLLADTLDKPIYVVSSDYAPALGAAVYAAVAAGLFDDVSKGSDLLGSKVEASYMPNPENVKHMQDYYASYLSLSNFIETNNKKQI